MEKYKEQHSFVAKKFLPDDLRPMSCFKSLKMIVRLYKKLVGRRIRSTKEEAWQRFLLNRAFLLHVTWSILKVV